MQELEQKDFLIEANDENKDVGIGLKMNLKKRPFSKNSHSNQGNKINANLKHIPDHMASKLVDDILNAKFTKD